MEEVIFALLRKHEIRPFFQICGQKALKFSNNPVLEGFLHVQVSNLSKLIFIFTSKNGIVFLACSKVNLILGCRVLSFSRNLVHDWSLSNIAKMSSIYLRYNLGDGSGSLHKS